VADSYVTYALRCANGAIGRHKLPVRTRRKVAEWGRDHFDMASHRCGPHKIMQATISISEWTEATPPEPPAWAVEAKWIKEQSERFACPRCAVEVGQPCENLVARAAGRVEWTKAPHAERTALWASSGGGYGG